ncbi:MAG: hypothetical protein JWN74_2111 [Acidobacteriaceae bacterium]|nr:hypothetical protein [Acidobacteriaceae bacterium]
MTFASPCARQNPILDENSFQQLLAAAYTLQEHNEALRARNARHDPARISSEIASTRSRILADGQDLATALALVAECLRSLTSADGASICLVNDGYLSCAACSGTAAKVPGGSVASNSLVATERLRNGRAFQSANARSDIRLEPELCKELHVGSLLAVPIQRNDEVAGLVELRWNNPDAFEDWDERICELAVGLIGEVRDRESGVVNAATPPADLAPAADASAENLSPITPKLHEPKADDPLPELSSSPAVSMWGQPLSAVHSSSARHEVEPSPSPVKCRVCGHPMTEKDEFCGHCGMLVATSDLSLQGKWASLWFMQQAQKVVETGDDQGERMWPIDEVHPEVANKQSDANPVSLKAGLSNVGDRDRDKDKEIQNTDETEAEEAVAGAKRGPRRVLSILKAQFKARVNGR